MSSETFSAFIENAPLENATDPNAYFPMVLDGATKKVPAPLLSNSVFLLTGDGNAAANLAAGQAALDQGGIVNFIGDGLIPLPSNTSWVIGSDTKLIVDDRAIITRVAGGTGANLIQSSAVYRAATTGWTSVTFTWAGGINLQITWPGHGFSVGDPVCTRGVSGTMPPQYFGTFFVTSVTDADTFTVLMARVPTTNPSGTSEALAADRRIRIYGGTWNYGYSRGVTPGSTYQVFGVFLAGVQDLEFDINAGDCTSHVVTTAGVRDVVARVHGNTPGEIYKMYGPTQNLELRGISGTAGDDVCSLQMLEPVAFAGLNFWGGGDCLDIRIRNIDGYSTSGEGAPGDGPGFHLYAHNWFYWDNVLVDNSGAPASGVSPPIALDSSEVSSSGGLIEIRGVRLPDPSAAAVAGGTILLTGTFLAKGVKVTNVSLPLDATSASGGMAPILQMDSTATAGFIHIDGVVGSALNTGHNPVRIAGNVTILSLANLNVSPTGTGAIFLGLLSGAQVGTVRITDSYLGAFDTLAYVNTGISNTPLIQMRNISSPCLNAARFDSSGSLDLEGGCVFPNINAGVGQVNGSGKTMTVYATLSNSYGGSLTQTSGGATATAKVYATLTGAEILTNKTLTSPTISDPTLSGVMHGVVKTDDNKVLIQPATATGPGYYQIINTGGTLDFGLDDSTGGTFGPAGAYGTNIYRPAATAFALSRAGTVDMKFSSAGALQLAQYGAGALSTDASGNVTATSDETLKMDFQPFCPPISVLRKISPIKYRWDPASGMETENFYAGFGAHNISAAFGNLADLVTGISPDSKLTLQDRALLAAAYCFMQNLDSRLSAFEKETGSRDAN